MNIQDEINRQLNPQPMSNEQIALSQLPKQGGFWQGIKNFVTDENVAPALLGLGVGGLGAAFGGGSEALNAGILGGVEGGRYAQEQRRKDENQRIADNYAAQKLEIERQNTAQSQEESSQNYVKMLGKLVADGTLDPSLASEYAKQYGFDIDFKSDTYKEDRARKTKYQADKAMYEADIYQQAAGGLNPVASSIVQSQTGIPQQTPSFGNTIDPLGLR